MRTVLALYDHGKKTGVNGKSRGRDVRVLIWGNGYGADGWWDSPLPASFWSSKLLSSHTTADEDLRDAPDYFRTCRNMFCSTRMSA
jgi:hypothetical protein